MRQSSLIAAVCLSVLGSYAGANTFASAPQPDNDFFYVGLHTGVANIHGSRLMQYDNITSISPRQNSSILGGEVGYEFMNHLAAEFGGSWIDSVKINSKSANDVRLNMYLGYLAARLSAPVFNHLNLFMKAGLGFQYQQSRLIFADNRQSMGADRSAFVPVFGLGASYDLNQRWQTSVQYMRFSSYFHHSVDDPSGDPKKHAITDNAFFTAKDLITFGVNYKFHM